MTFLYLDTETTGLDPMLHEPWEVAYAVDEGPIFSSFLPLVKLSNANPEALKIGGFDTRYQEPKTGAPLNSFVGAMLDELFDVTVVGSNPRFDVDMLQHGFFSGNSSIVVWKHRLLDVPTYAMGLLGHSEPQGLHTVASELRELGYSIPVPDHTAEGDVACVRACHRAIAAGYGARA